MYNRQSCTQTAIGNAVNYFAGIGKCADPDSGGYRVHASLQAVVGRPVGVVPLVIAAVIVVSMGKRRPRARRVPVQGLILDLVSGTDVIASDVAEII
jgi:hypothetical protein